MSKTELDNSTMFGFLQRLNIIRISVNLKKNLKRINVSCDLCLVLGSVNGLALFIVYFRI